KSAGSTRNRGAQSILRLSRLQSRLSHVLLRGLSVIRRADQASHNRASRHDPDSPGTAKEVDCALTGLFQASKRRRANTLNRAGHAGDSSRRTAANRSKSAACPIPAITGIKRSLLRDTTKFALILRILL